MAADFKKAYAKKLKDPRWQRRRLEILQMDDWKCASCGDGTSTLHVHHKAYRQGAEPWEATDFALTTLCESCHKYETDNRHRIETLVYLVRCLFDADGAEEMIDEMRGAADDKLPTELWGEAFLAGLRDRRKWFREHGRTSGPAVPSVPEASCEGGCQEGDHEGSAEGVVRAAD